MAIEAHSVEEVVVAAIAAACRLAPATVTRATRLLELGMDSLTLVTVLSQIEAALETRFDADDVVDLLRAQHVAELVAAVRRKL
jgi:acyl carrier protein